MATDTCCECGKVVTRVALSLASITCHRCRRVEWQCMQCGVTRTMSRQRAAHTLTCGRGCPERPVPKRRPSHRKGDPRGLGAYKKARLELMSLGLGCWICRTPIDYSLKWPNPGSFSADHYLEVHAGGQPDDVANLRAAHLGCNSRRGALYQQGRNTRPSETERDW